MASAGTNDVSVALAGLNCTSSEFAVAVFAAGILASMREPLWNAAFERKLVRAPPRRHGAVALQGCGRIAAKAQLSFAVRAGATVYSVCSACASRVHELERADGTTGGNAIERLGGDRVGFFDLWPGHCIPGHYLPSR